MPSSWPLPSARSRKPWRGPPPPPARAPDSRPATGPSFRDAARVAGANSAIWTDISLSSAGALADRLDDAIARLTEFRATLATSDSGAVTAWNDAARADRRRLLDAQVP